MKVFSKTPCSKCFDKNLVRTVIKAQNLKPNEPEKHQKEKILDKKHERNAKRLFRPKSSRIKQQVHWFPWLIQRKWSNFVRIKNRMDGKTTSSQERPKLKDFTMKRTMSSVMINLQLENQTWQNPFMQSNQLMFHVMLPHQLWKYRLMVSHSKTSTHSLCNCHNDDHAKGHSVHQN